MNPTAYAARVNLRRATVLHATARGPRRIVTAYRLARASRAHSRVLNTLHVTTAADYARVTGMGV